MTNNRTQEHVLITGVTGYIGFQTLTIALERGYRVRAVVRKETNVAALKRSPEIAKSLERAQLQIVVIPDFLEKDSFFNCLYGINVIIHLASPLAIETDDYDAGIVKPAVSMVTTVLEAASRVPSIRRVVLTSSCVTLIPFAWNTNPDTERLYKVTDFNTTVEGPFSGAMQAYWASKALARAATKDFVRKTRPQFDFVNLLPSVVIGPDDRLDFDPFATTDSLLQGTRSSILAPALTASHNSPFPYVGTPVHVADVARAHVDAVDGARVPGDSEFILSSDTPDGIVWDRDIHNICNTFFHEEVSTNVLPMEGSLRSLRWRLDTQETQEIFGWQFIPFEETMTGLVSQYLRLHGRKAL